MLQSYNGGAYTVNPHVVFTDELGVPHAALLTQVWSANDAGEPMTVNLVYVTDDPTKTDPYGLQIERKTSITRKNEHSAHGFFFELVSTAACPAVPTRCLKPERSASPFNAGP